MAVTALKSISSNNRISEAADYTWVKIPKEDKEAFKEWINERQESNSESKGFQKIYSLSDLVEKMKEKMEESREKWRDIIGIGIMSPSRQKEQTQVKGVSIDKSKLLYEITRSNSTANYQTDATPQLDSETIKESSLSSKMQSLFSQQLTPTTSNTVSNMARSSLSSVQSPVKQTELEIG